MELELWNKYSEDADNALTFQLVEIVVDKCSEGVFGRSLYWSSSYHRLELPSGRQREVWPILRESG